MFGPIRAASMLVVGMAAISLSTHARDEPPRVSHSRALSRAEAIAGGATAALREGAAIAINQASSEDLQLLPGVGPAIAARIVESRRRDGPFRAPESLLRVSGIGPRTLERLRPLIEFSDRSESVDDERQPNSGRDGDHSDP